MKRTFFLLALTWCLIWSGWKCWAQDGDIFVVISGRRISNVVVVAKSGGQYKSIQEAVDSITDATALNPYLVVVGPGWYTESVTLIPFVHLQGAGKNVTYINSDVSNIGGSLTQATVVLNDSTSVRDVSILNWGTGNYNVALLAPDGTNGAVVSDVEAYYSGLGSGGESTRGVYVVGSGTRVTLQNVTAVGQQGSLSNYGLTISDATVVLLGGTFTGKGGQYARGIYNGGTLKAIGITAIGENGTHYLYGNFALVGAGNSESNINQSVLEGDDRSVECVDLANPATVSLTHSRLAGPVSAACANLTCVGVSEGTTFYTDTCP